MQLVPETPKQIPTKLAEIGFTCGAADLFHPGHMLMVKEAKERACNYLIFGLHRDPTIDRPNTKNKTVMTVEERRIMLQGCRYIDEIWEYDTEAQLLAYLTEQHALGRIGVRIVGEDYVGKDFTGRDIGIPIYYNSRKHDYSTSNLRIRTYKAEHERLARMQLVAA